MILTHHNKKQNFPQIYENYRNSNASSLHLAFLIQWILGDSLNLIGAVLTGQLTTYVLFFPSKNFCFCSNYSSNWLTRKILNAM